MTGDILLVDLCYEPDSLSKYEFVLPVAGALKRHKSPSRIMHYTEVCEKVANGFDKVILCGTALKDNAYSGHLDSFSWIFDRKKPLLGICAGMQVISSVFGGYIVSQPAIGLETIEIIRDSPLLGSPRRIEGYHLHNFGASLPDDFQLLAGCPEAPSAFEHKHRPIFGIIFHPEVRNHWILERFADLQLWC
ncbi:GMP synthase [glutamine-hydrolyzing] subunit A [uncultured archaeon]|nr:GMP synthase [glutamine-hydrolyzing] subunit A [uncultured archaeon]